MWVSASAENPRAPRAPRVIALPRAPGHLPCPMGTQRRVVALSPLTGRGNGARGRRLPRQQHGLPVAGEARVEARDALGVAEAKGAHGEPRGQGHRLLDARLRHPGREAHKLERAGAVAHAEGRDRGRGHGGRSSLAARSLDGRVLSRALAIDV